MKNKIIQFKDVVNKQYNYLTVISEVTPIIIKCKNKSNYKGRQWLFRCICGKEKIISPSNVFNGSIKSCGCMRKKLMKDAVAKYYKKEYVKPVEGRAYSRYKVDAKKHNRIFSLSRKEFDEIVNSNCYYCGIEPFLIQGNKTKSIIKKLNGVDRINSSKGYTIDNVVPCCIHCNKAKNTMSIADFTEWIKRVYNHLK